MSLNEKVELLKNEESIQEVENSEQINENQQKLDVSQLEKPQQSTINSSNEESKTNQENSNKQENKSQIANTEAKKLNADTKQMNMFLSPMLDDLEKIINDNMKQLDKLEEDLFGDDRKKRENIKASHIPEAIRERKSIESIMKNLEEMIVNSPESGNDVLTLDPSEKKNREYLQGKVNKTSEMVKEKMGKRKLANEEKEKIDSESDNLVKETSLFNFENSKIGQLNNITCLAHSLAAYLITSNSRRNYDKLKNITVKIYDAVNLWLSRLFRFYDSSVLFHDQEPEGLIRMCTILMNFKFKEYQKSGYMSINKQPSIYISAASKYALPEYRELISVQLGVPYNSLKLVEVSKANNNTLDKIDMEKFLKQLEEDVENGFAPLIIVANAGSHGVGQCDDIQQLNELSTKFKMWVHLEGIYLSTLVLYSVPTAVQPVTSGDSITINFGNWIGVPSLCYATIYKNVKNSNVYLQSYNSVTSTLHKCLPYWCVLQAIGHDGVMQRVKFANDMSYYISQVVNKYKPYLRTLTFKGERQETISKRYSFQELIAKAINFLTFVDLNNPVVIFRCDKDFIKERLFFGNDFSPLKLSELNEKKKKPNEYLRSKEEFLKMMHEPEPELFLKPFKQTKNDDAKIEELEDSEEVNEYTDTLTTWLCDLLNSLHKNMEFELIEIENEGVCIRFSPIEHVNVYATNEHDIHVFDKSLEDIISILDASIKSKLKFDKEIKEFKNLKPVKIRKWAGIGAVRYIPDYLMDKLDEINKHLSEIKEASDHTQEDEEECKTVIEAENNEETKSKNEDEEKLNSEIEKYIKEINEMNEQLVKNLQAQDGAFSIGLATDGLKAVKFGMTTDIDSVKNLAAQVQDCGKEFEDASRFYERMTDLIIHGIEKANQDLKKENKDKAMQQGVLRQIPIVGGLLSWLSPVEAKNTAGRTFNLQSGKIASTEVTYKYKIQLEEESAEKTRGAKSLLDKTPENKSAEMSRRDSSSSFNSNVSSLNLHENPTNEHSTLIDLITDQNEIDSHLQNLNKN